MKTLIMTSNSFSGQVIFEYGNTGRLEVLRIEAELDANQLKWVGSNIPWNESGIDQFVDSTKKLIFSLTDREVTFDMFWNTYNDKSRSSKKKTIAVWNKLSQADQVKAYCYIPLYIKSIGNLGKKYAETYLNAELWNN